MPGDEDEGTAMDLMSKNEGKAAEKLAVEGNPAKLSTHAMPLRQYLDLHIVPTLLPALNYVATERPENPTEFLAYYLLKNNPMNKKDDAAGGDQAPATSEPVDP